jgi:hypothetical protein
MANTVFTASSPILHRVEMLGYGETDMLGIEFFGYGCLLLAFTAVQYACLLSPVLKA